MFQPLYTQTTVGLGVSVWIKKERKKDEQFGILANSVLAASGWFLSTLRVFLVTEHLVMKVRHLRKLMAVVLAEISRLIYVLGSLWDVRAIPTYRVYRTCDNTVDAHTGPMG